INRVVGAVNLFCGVPEEGDNSMMAKSRVNLSYVLLCILALATFAGAAHAQVAKQGFDTLSSLAFTHERLAYSQPIEPLENVQSAVSQATHSAWSTFRLSAPVEWRA